MHLQCGSGQSDVYTQVTHYMCSVTLSASTGYEVAREQRMKKRRPIYRKLRKNSGAQLRSIHTSFHSLKMDRRCPEMPSLLFNHNAREKHTVPGSFLID